MDPVVTVDAVRPDTLARNLCVFRVDLQTVGVETNCLRNPNLIA